MKTKLTIFLFKDGISENSEILKDYDSADLMSQSIGNGIFYYKIPRGNRPKWFSSFFNDSIDLQFFESKSIQAVYIVRIVVDDETERVFAITFGYGRNLLNINNVENRFGLLVTLNTLDSSSIRCVDTHEVASSGKAQRTQVSRLLDFSNFDFDFNFNRDYLYSIIGRTENEYSDRIGRVVTGKNSLSINVENNYLNVNEVLTDCYSLFKSDNYKRSFEWIDKSREITDRTSIENLNNILLRRLVDKEIDSISLIAPEIIDWDGMARIVYGKRSNIEYEDFDILDALNELGNNLTIQQLKNTHMKIQNSNGDNMGHWPLFKCLNGEIWIENKLYILNYGVWYEFSSDYVSEVNNAYENIPLGDVDLSRFSQQTDEGKYNEDEVNRYTNRRVLMDKKLIRPRGASSYIEFCDIMEDGCKFIHVKKYSGSATLSHLFNQGYVSAQVFMNKSFRCDLNNMLQEMMLSNPIVFPDETFKCTDYTIIFAIVKNEDTDRPKIPFFSKVALRNIYSTLVDCGYKVQIQRIDMD